MHRHNLVTSVGVTLIALLSTGAFAADIGPSQQKGEPESDWKIELGAGAMFGPKYEGSNNYTVIPYPKVSVDYQDGLVFMGVFDGIGSYPIRGQDYKVGASIGFDFGRAEDDDEDNLRGMGDIDSSVNVNLMGEYDFGPAKVSTKLTKGDDSYGMTVEADIGTMLPITENIMVMGKVGTKWADEDHMNSYFGVSAAQATRSRNLRFTAESGFKTVSFSLGAFYNVSENWDVMVMVNGDQLIGDAADSPLSKQDFQPTALIGTSYKF